MSDKKTCGNCEHFNSELSNSFGDCHYPLPIWLQPMGCSTLVRADDEGCPVHEPLEQANE